jgi:hypothetical protein
MAQNPSPLIYNALEGLENLDMVLANFFMVYSLTVYQVQIYGSKAPHSKLWGITGKGAPLPQVTDGLRFLSPSKLCGIQRRFL